MKNDRTFRPEKAPVGSTSPALFRCTLCETTFAADVADPGPQGEPRCPQCGLFEAVPEVPPDDGFVVRSDTPFR